MPSMPFHATYSQLRCRPQHYHRQRCRLWRLPLEVQRQQPRRRLQPVLLLLLPILRQCTARSSQHLQGRTLMLAHHLASQRVASAIARPAKVARRRALRAGSVHAQQVATAPRAQPRRPRSPRRRSRNSHNSSSCLVCSTCHSSSQRSSQLSSRSRRCMSTCNSRSRSRRCKVLCNSRNRQCQGLCSSRSCPCMAVCSSRCSTPWPSKAT